MTKLAFDRSSVRTIDIDGRMHVELTPISKAQVSPYYGREIPGADALGLDPDEVYQLLRPADELEKAAATFNNLPLLSIHQPTSADEHPKEITVGSTGTDAVFNAPYLMNSLVVWDGESVRDIESDSKRELSCGYRYTPVLESGLFEGQSYDIRMTDIIGNHVALVPVGRAGPDVLVQDANPFPPKLEQVDMKKLTPHAHAVAGALRAFLTPLLAQDKAIPSLSAIVQGVTAKTYTEDKAKLAEKVTKAVSSLLAKDAKLDGLKLALDAMEPDEDDKKAEDEDPEDPKKDDKDDKTANDNSEIVAMLESLLSRFKGAEGAVDEETPPRAKEPENAKEAPKAMDAQAMDAALKAQRDGLTATYRATQEVKPIIGEVDALAFDSAEAVYAMALTARGIDPKTHNPAGYRGMVAILAKTGTTTTHTPVMAADAATDFPGLGRITQL